MKIASKASLSLAAAAGLVFCAFGASDGYLSFEDDTARTIVFGNRRVYVFTNASAAVTLTAQRDLTLEEFLVVGGGGAGGSSAEGGGGGGGGVVHGRTPVALASGDCLSALVGAGGLPHASYYGSGNQGGHSSLTIGAGDSIEASGGGGGAYSGDMIPPAAVVEGKIGSGGGSSNGGGIGTEGTQWKQGKSGGKGVHTGDYKGYGGGGGGAGSAGAAANGGEGLSIDITGEYVVYGSGGGGGSRRDTVNGVGGSNAGAGGRGIKGQAGAFPPEAGTTGFGGGGGGGGQGATRAGEYSNGARGGSGTVILVLTVGDHTENRFEIEPIRDQVFTGEAVEPVIAVTNRAGVVLTLGTDYTVSYLDNGAPGTGIAIATGVEGTAYEGYSAFARFTILDAAFCDDYIVTSDGTLQRKVFGSRLVYVFTNAAAPIMLEARGDLTLEEYLVVGGGGAGGGSIGSGGGGGGVVYAGQPMTIAAGEGIAISVGAGGRPGASISVNGQQGGHSSVKIGSGQPVMAYGGGGGASGQNALDAAKSPDAIGSGGGGSSIGTKGAQWSQGNPGGVRQDAYPQAEKSYGGGGGGALTAGSGRTGGEGRSFTLTGAAVVYGSGGGGGTRSNTVAGKGGTNAGDGAQGMSTGYQYEKRGGFGVDGTGGGGGGGCFSGKSSPLGGDGGCGTVVLVFTSGDHTAEAFSVLPVADQVYTDEAVEPVIAVTNRAGVVLTLGMDYTVSYLDNGAPGTGIAIATGVEGTAYEGFSAFARFVIHDAAFEDDYIAASDGTAQAFVVGKRHVYVFTNAAAVATVKIMQLATLDDMVIVGGGGGGGGSIAGGGGGGHVLQATDPTVMAAGDLLTLKVGNGGRRGEREGESGYQGGSSWLSYCDGATVQTAWGGGGGASSTPKVPREAEVEGRIGSGGGSSYGGGVGTEGAQWWFGNPGGAGKNSNDTTGYGGGGGGASTAGSGSQGGEGLELDITGAPVVYGSGGGGGSRQNPGPGNGGTNGGCGGQGVNGAFATPGADGTGSGGGGAGSGGGSPDRRIGADGGCGTVIFVLTKGDHVNNRFGIAQIDDQMFRNRPVEPKIVVTNMVGMVLIEGRDYTVSYVNNEGVGVAKAVATGVADSDFDGFSTEQVFNILPGGYLDENLDTSDPTVRMIPLDGKFVYVFTNTSAAVSLTVLRNLTLVESLVVGGGGGGGNGIGGGGGGGGIVHGTRRVVLPGGMAASVVVGAGGVPRTTSYRLNGTQGGLSSFAFGTTVMTAYGGGGGAGSSGPTSDANGRIGSGGGRKTSEQGLREGVDWNPEYLGHQAGLSDENHGGGGGGAGAVGSGANGGEGLSLAITGEGVVYGSGGGGGARDPSSKYQPGQGGTNAGSGQFGDVAFPAEGGKDGTGSGGGGGGYAMPKGAYEYNSTCDGGNGGCGTVILVFEPGGEIGQPKVGAIGIDFPDGHTQPMVSATITGTEEGVSFLAEVVVRARIGDGDWLDAHTFTDVTNGQTVAFLANFAAAPGEKVVVDVAVTATGATPVSEADEAEAVGTYPESYGKGGGAGVIHVNPAATGRNDGSDWFNAYTDFRAALAKLDATHAELWLAGDETLAKGQPATIAPPVAAAIRGGFAGVETNAADRVAGGHSTMDGSNLYNPFVLANDAALTLDGFKVVRAKTRAISKSKGGDLTIVNCVLDGNGLSEYGKGVPGRAVYAANAATATIRLCDALVSRNGERAGWSSSNGQAVYLESLKGVVLENCQFVSNGVVFAGKRFNSETPGRGPNCSGGTLYAKDVPVTARNCRFSASRTGGWTNTGGIVRLDGNCGASSFKNCVFTGNESVFPIDTYSATNPGLEMGTLVLDATAGTLDVENCTFAWNLAEAGRGATGVEVAGGTANVKNCIFHGGVVGTNNVAGVDIDVMAGGTANVSYCLFDADDGLRLGCEEGGTLNPQTQTFRYGDPLLTTEIDVMALVQTNRVAKTAQISFKDSTEGAFVTADVHERRHSPAIDTGDRKSPYANEPKPNGRRVNLGAYGNTPEAAKSPDGGVLIVR